MKTYYRHLRTEDNMGGITFAMQKIPLSDDWLFGIAICDRRDMYNKKKGRLIAQGRMRTQRSLRVEDHMCGILLNVPQENGHVISTNLWQQVLDRALDAIKRCSSDDTYIMLDMLLRLERACLFGDTETVSSIQRAVTRYRREGVYA